MSLSTDKNILIIFRGDTDTTDGLGDGWFKNQAAKTFNFTESTDLAISAGQAKKYAIAVTRNSFSYILSKEIARKLTIRITTSTTFIRSPTLKVLNNV